ncbi:uncharacterized protein LOC131218281 [Magnolia sinica]|uniref:uncharacterized protein LOC131218281 n=1 Tax=Magnolia sinica TaxID=86752 RepID=UPI00265AC996|nr:uncharacterized protein LOC131218281 [Magnolia sinica]XP_058068926.1 uncharacterized protein LOC131218281 [Magnolia sinica]XP_058068927.1 uncharacterized protein LOC131218281 [Magnolia sinica]XP_058068928.1 uncharacterized protein LOC131218281 [Magnolia sinica]
MIMTHNKSAITNGGDKPLLDPLVLNFLQNINDLLAVGVLARSRRAVLMNWKHQDCKPLPDPQKCTRRILDQALREIALLNMDCGTDRNSDGETSVNNVDIEGSQEVTTDAISTRGPDVELRYAHEVAGNRDDCSTSETHQSGTCCRRSPRSRSHTTGERSRRKR